MPEVFTPGTSTPPDLAYTLPLDGDNVSFASLMTAIIKPLATGLSYVANNVGSGALAGAWTWALKQTFTTGIEISSGGLAAILGTLSLSKAPIVALGAAGDADSTIDVSSPAWILAGASVLRVDTMRSTTAPIPATGQVVMLRMDQGGAAARRVSREGGSIICTLVNDANDPACAWVYWTGTVWRLLMYSAHVTPGPAA